MKAWETGILVAEIRNVKPVCQDYRHITAKTFIDIDYTVVIEKNFPPRVFVTCCLNRDACPRLIKDTVT